MIKIQLPVSEEEVRKLKIGDEVYLTGKMVTGRDSAHTYLLEKFQEDLAPILENTVIYHCGPVVKKEGDLWSFVAAGPTTSIRDEPYEADVIKNYHLRGVIGKGGMGEKTLKACKDYGAVYFHAVGGVAVVLAKSVKQVLGVYKLEEFGVPEAFWHIDVVDFPVIVTMDSHSNSIHKDVLSFSKSRKEELFKL
ncbi:MAG TPA: FumA C-terminus/TtdB family hydratase beta subunit [Candidatus Eremiobacteraeota bacterium]|nr:MAG: L(+)-tartrate dehydratase subunit beta [bacterium ADurb.Bin363]HPZ07846.1 FumA C-terminus/TtdB family hydratase beta subunit [Candidatus Eremiobacteraeota bacterium]